MSDSCSDVESAKKRFATAFFQLAKKIEQYRVDGRLDEAEIVKLDKIMHDLKSSFDVIADATEGRL
ncbi:MAG: hypothetical protein OXN90_01960 [Gemmatimonadota bacterium]|nr:hypothetical protein [Gemmatimonadota bacterium]